MILFFHLLLGCSTGQPESPSQAGNSEVTPPTEQLIKAPSSSQNVQNTAQRQNTNNLDNGQKHPPLPADNPIWEWDAQSFVPDHGWFGEHNWGGVRMRVMGQLAIGYRELARSYLAQEQWNEGLEQYQALAQYLQNIRFSNAAFAEEIRQTLLKATRRDISLVQALQQKSVIPKAEGFAALRHRYYALVQNNSRSEAEVIALQKELEPYLQLRADLDIASFENFTDRHRLRSRLFQAYSEAIDPLANADLRWGYWRAEEIQRQALALGLALAHLGGTNWQDRLKDWSYTPPDLKMTSPLFYPSLISKNLKDQDSLPEASAAEFGRLPTGDSLIDVGGQPGPFGIGSLMKLDHTDPEHSRWLETTAEQIVSALENNPEQSVQYCQAAIKKLDSYSHGSRFYNVKQMRNACTRQLAKAGHFAEAETIFQGSFPLHHQDWACPNREGLLLTISGRLKLQAGQIEDGRRTLQQAIESGYDFLEKIDKAEKGELREPRPPRINIGPQGPSNKRLHNPSNAQKGPGLGPHSSPSKQK